MPQGRPASCRARSCSGCRQPADRPRRVVGDIIAPTLVLHGEDDPFFPIGNGEAPAAEIPDARLVRLGRAGHRLPAHPLPIVAEELIAHTAR
jgi:pimeloyl-ACP methyl ester carboxylesterase